jgi:hypothetical protein
VIIYYYKKLGVTVKSLINLISHWEAGRRNRNKCCYQKYEWINCHDKKILFRQGELFTIYPWNCVVIIRFKFNTILNCLKYNYITYLDFVLFELSSNSFHIILADCWIISDVCLLTLLFTLRNTKFIHSW